MQQALSSYKKGWRQINPRKGVKDDRYLFTCPRLGLYNPQHYQVLSFYSTAFTVPLHRFPAVMRTQTLSECTQDRDIDRTPVFVVNGDLRLYLNKVKEWLHNHKRSMEFNQKTKTFFKALLYSFLNLFLTIVRKLSGMLTRRVAQTTKLQIVAQLSKRSLQCC